MSDPASDPPADVLAHSGGAPGSSAPRTGASGDLSRRVLELLGPCLDEATLLRELHTVVGDWVPHDAGVVARYHDGTPPHLDVTSQRGFDGTPLAATLPLPELLDPCDLTAGPVWIHDLHDTPERVAAVFARREMRSLLLVPLGYDEQVCALVVLAARQPSAFATVSAAAIEEFRRLIAVPLRNAGCFATAQQESADNLRLAEHLYTLIGTDDRAAPPVPALLQVALEQAGADAGTVMALDPTTGSLYVRTARGLRGDYPGAAQLPWGTSLLGALPAMTGSLVFDNLSVDPAQPFGAFAAAEGICAYHGLPLRQGGHPNGLLNLYWRRSPPPAGADPRRLDLTASALALALVQDALRATDAANVALRAQFHQHKDDLLGLLAHQLRTPITTIKGFAQLLLRRHQETAGNPTARYAEKVVLEANRLAVMVNNVLDLSRLEQALIDTVQRPLDLAELLVALQGDPQVQALAADRALHWQVPATPVLVCGDMVRLKQALLALLHRAAVCAPAGHPLDIALRAAPTAGDSPRRITLTVVGGEPPDPGLRLDDLLNRLDLRMLDRSNAASYSDLTLYIALQLLRAQEADLTIEPDLPKTIRYVAHFYPLEDG